MAARQIQYLTAQEAAASIPHLLPGEAQAIVVTGRRHQGKSTLIRSYIQAAEPRVLLLDPFGDFDKVRRRLDLDQAIDELATGEPFRRRISISWKSDTQEFAAEFFAKVLDRVKDCLIVLDEIQLWTETHPDRIDPSFKKILFQGRKGGLRLIMASQQIQHFGVILSELTTLAIFNTEKPEDIDRIKKWTDETCAENCQTLDRGHCALVTL